ncbi:MAG: nitroreductase family protein [Methanomassiliicoccales archaeon]|nr:nitroreductase family protein [Methanomassiliicoccales archaeon]
MDRERDIYALLTSFFDGMDVKEAIRRRRATRAFEAKDVEGGSIDELIESMRLSPSCNNNQPWRVIVTRGPALEKVKTHLSKGNSWARRASLILVVCARLDDDCKLADRRDYYLFSTGIAVGEMLLRATEMGVIAHPIAGYNAVAIKHELEIPDDHVLITLVICGHPGTDVSLLSEKQLLAERERPPRRPVGENFYRDRWGEPWR